MDTSEEEQDALREEVISELRQTGMHYDVMDFEYIHVGVVREGEEFPTGTVPEDALEMLRASAPAVYMQQPESCPLCDYECKSADYVLADRETNKVYTYSHLLFHLIEEHGYRPPKNFFDAVRRQFANPDHIQPAHDAPPAIRGMQPGTLPFFAPRNPGADDGTFEV